MNSFDEIHDIFFDLDHTLWDFDRNSLLAFKQIFVLRQLELNLQDFMDVYEPINWNYWKSYREERVTKDELRRGRFRDSFSRFDIHMEDHELDQMATDYLDELPKNNHLFDGTKEVLAYLNQDYRLHIITNGFEEVQHKKLENSGIAPFFDTVTTSEEAGVKKPAAQIFRLAMEKAGTSSGRSLMIGDTYEADIVGAKNLGMSVLFFNYRKEDIPSEIVKVDSLLELKKHL